MSESVIQKIGELAKKDTDITNLRILDRFGIWCFLRSLTKLRLMNVTAKLAAEEGAGVFGCA